MKTQLSKNILKDSIFVSILSSCFVAINSSVSLAGTFLGSTNFSPTSVQIPSSGFTSAQTFTFNAQLENTTSLTFHTTLTFEILEVDPFLNDAFSRSFTFMEMPGISNVSVVATLTAAELNNQTAEDGFLEFQLGAVTVRQVPKTTPEPISSFSLLALGTLGAASTLKRKLKPSKSTGRELEKVS